MSLTASELEELREAKALLESPGLAIRLTNRIGRPIEWGLSHLPDWISRRIDGATGLALRVALRTALFTMGKGRPKPADHLHRRVVLGSGAVGGFFGLAGALVELPISTTVMLRSIADQARSQGETLANRESQFACLEVFAFGGLSQHDDGAESGYFAVRSALAKAVGEAATFIAERGVVREGAPVMVRLIAEIASRFGVSVSQKLAAGLVPAIGAVSAASINGIFIGHFQDMARGHFTVRRLERVHGQDAVLRAFNDLSG